MPKPMDPMDGLLRQDRVVAAQHSNPIVDLLVRLLTQTQAPVPPKKKAPVPDGTGAAKMAATKGPIRAETAKKAASKRDGLMKQIP